MNERLQKANALQVRAHAVIGHLGLNTLWAEVGKPVLVGSVRFGLLCKPNIDYEVYTPVPTIAAGFSVIRRIAEVPGVRQIQYHNFLETSDPGLYWRIDYVDEDGVLWDIDNWLIADDHPHAGVADRLAAAMDHALTDDDREAILTIKDALRDDSTVRGIDVYKAVLRDRVASPEAFRQWFLENPPGDEIDAWHP